MGQPTGSGGVAADAARIDALGDTFIRWSQDVDRLGGDIGTTKITPGSGPNAEPLRQRFNQRVVQDYANVLANLQRSLYAIGSALNRIADVYRETENLNRDDADRLNGLIQSVGTIYPNLRPGGTMPVPPQDTSGTNTSTSGTNTNTSGADTTTGTGTTTTGTGTSAPGTGTTAPAANTTAPGTGTTAPAANTTAPGTGTTAPSASTAAPGADGYPSGKFGPPAAPPQPPEFGTHGPDRWYR